MDVLRLAIVGLLLTGCTSASLSTLPQAEQDRWRRCEADLQRDCESEVQHGNFASVAACMRETEHTYATGRSEESRRSFLARHHCAASNINGPEVASNASSGGESSAN